LSFDVRVYRPGDEQKIVELLELVFKGWPKFDLPCSPVEHWVWKFQDNLRKTKMVLVAESGDDVIGCNHAIFEMVKVGRETLLCRQGVDSAVRPDFRGMGVYTKMSELKAKLDSEIDLGLHYAISTNPIIVKHSGDDHPSFPHSVADLTRIRDIDLHMAKNDVEQALIKKYGYLTVRAMNTFNRKAALPRKGPGFEVSNLDRFGEETDVFWGKIKDSYSFIAERSSSYLNWRFRDPRGGRYIVKQAVDGEGLVGYVVSRINSYRADYPVGYIVDLCTLPGRLDAADALLSDSVDYLDGQGINVINSWMVKGHPYERVLKRHGFLETRKVVSVSATPGNLGEEFKNFSNAPADRLLFQYGDSDWI
jgi:hypothetical protein